MVNYALMPHESVFMWCKHLKKGDFITINNNNNNNENNV